MNSFVSRPNTTEKTLSLSSCFRMPQNVRKARSYCVESVN